MSQSTLLFTASTQDRERGQGGVDSQKSSSSSIEQQSADVFTSGAAGLWLRSKPDPTRTPAATEKQAYHFKYELTYFQISKASVITVKSPVSFSLSIMLCNFL